MSGATGANLVFGFRKNSNPWGSGAPVLVGAGHQVEVEALPLAAAAELIQNVGLTGQGTRRPSKLGNRVVQADIGPCPLYFRGLEVLTALGMGVAVTPAQLGGSAAHDHAYQMAPSHLGLFGTGVAAGVDHPGVREFPHLKIAGITWSFQQGALGKVTYQAIAFDEWLNVGSPSPALIVASVEPADGALTVAAQPPYPSPLTVTVVDANTSITEYIVDFVGEDDRGNLVTERYQLSVDGLLWTSQKRWSRVDSATASALAGIPTGDTITVGVSNGVNNASTFPSIALPTTADYQLMAFEQMKVWVNQQDGADFVDADLVYPDAVTITLNNAQQPKFTTKFGNRSDEPNSQDFRMVEIGINLPEWDADNNRLLRDRLLARPHKVKVQIQGAIAAATFPLEHSFYLQNVQFREGSVPVSGAGEVRFDLTGEAHRALVAPTGQPSWANLQPLSVRNVNLRTTSALS